MVKVAIIYYSMYGHVAKLAQAIKKGAESVGANVDLYRIPETLSEEVLSRMHAPPIDKDIPEATMDTLIKYDHFLFGIPTRFGNMPGQWKAFIDQTGGFWYNGALYGKTAGIFVSTATQGGGQEITVMSILSFLVHHGITFVPLGYKNAFQQMSVIDQVHGGSPWGSGTFAGPDGSRQPTELELEIAAIQGSSYVKTITKSSS